MTKKGNATLLPGSIYYALAVFDYFDDDFNKRCLISDIQEQFHAKLPSQLGELPLLTDEQLFESALQFLTRIGAIEVDKDDYGPPIITLQNSIDSLNESNLSDKDFRTVGRYLKSGDRKNEWLIAALINLRNNPPDEKTRPPSGEPPAADEDSGWEPLPLDRSNSALEDVIARTDALLEEVRANNGYGVEHAEEKRLVVDLLGSFSKTIKQETTISWMYVKEFAIKPIEIILRRFGPAAVGIAADAAKAAIKEWLKKKGLNFLDGF